MKILVVGCGGRENILIEKLNKDKTNDLYCTGPWINPDIYEMCKEYSIMNLTIVNELFEDDKCNNELLLGPNRYDDNNYILL